MEDMAHDFRVRNNTEQEFSENFVHLPPFLALICIAGILINGALLYILTKIDLHNALNGFILSLTLSNLLFLVFFMPFDAVAIGSKSYPFSEGLCKATETISSACFFVWPFTLIALIARRILDTTEGGVPKTTVAAIIVIWTVALSLAIPAMLLAYGVERGDDEKIMYCPTYDISYLSLEILVQFATILVVPLMAVGCYICDIKRRNRTGNNHSREQKDMFRLVLVLVVVYTVCQFPRSLLDIFSMFLWYDYNVFWHALDIIAFLLYLLYPVAWPAALFWASGSFRKLFKRHVLFWRKPRNQEPVVPAGSQPLVSPTRTPVPLSLA